MNLLENLSGLLGGGEGGGMHPQLLSGLAQMFFSQGGNGLQGIIAMFQQKDLGHVIQSWIGTGANLPISAEQIKGVLGQANLQALAAKAGLSPQQASEQLAQHLPGMVDKMTPDGQLPDASALEGLVMGMLKG